MTPQPQPQVIIPLLQYQKLIANKERLGEIIKNGNATSVFAVDCVQKILLEVHRNVSQKDHEITPAKTAEFILQLANDKDSIFHILKDENGL